MPFRQDALRKQHLPRRYARRVLPPSGSCLFLQQIRRMDIHVHHNRGPLAACRPVFACRSNRIPYALAFLSTCLAFTHLGQRPELRIRPGEVLLLRVKVEVADDEALLLLLSHIWSKGVRRRRDGDRAGGGGRTKSEVATCTEVVYLRTPSVSQPHNRQQP